MALYIQNHSLEDEVRTEVNRRINGSGLDKNILASNHYSYLNFKSPATVYAYINEGFFGTIRADHSIRRQRFARLLYLLKVDKEKDRDLLEKVNRIYPDFQYPPKEEPPRLIDSDHMKTYHSLSDKSKELVSMYAKKLSKQESKNA